MQSYLNIVKKILAQGKAKPDRTGTGTIAIAGHMFQHDMASGFPLLTTKKVPYRMVDSGSVYFIK